LRERLAAEAEAMRRDHALIEAAQRDADRLLPDLLRLYLDGDDVDRATVRALLTECPSFRWGFGWGAFERIATTDDARNALALLSMKDGGGDWRDQIVALDRLCAMMRNAGLPVAALLREAATWSSDAARPAPARSMRELLLDRAVRFAG